MGRDETGMAYSLDESRNQVADCDRHVEGQEGDNVLEPVNAVFVDEEAFGDWFDAQKINWEDA